MERFLRYIIILVFTAIATFVLLSTELYVFNAQVDFSVAGGTSIFLVPILTMVSIVYMEMYPKMKGPQYLPVVFIWGALVIAAGISYLVSPAIFRSVVFYELTVAIVLTLVILYIHSSSKAVK